MFSNLKVLHQFIVGIIILYTINVIKIKIKLKKKKHSNVTIIQL